MKLLLLCAGYGTRLEKDLEECNDQRFRSLKGLPKPLLPICGKALISHWVEAAEDVQDIDEIILVTNNHFFKQFCQWKSKLENIKPVSIINDGTKSNSDRLGAVADIQLVIQELQLKQEHLLIVAGDTLFYPDFSLKKFVDKFHQLQRDTIGGNLIIHCPCPEERVHLHGIVELSPENTSGYQKVTSFLEKPKPDQTTSRTQSPCFYLLHTKSVQLVEAFLDSTKTMPISSRDATGNFLAFLIRKADVFSHGISGRFDVGNLQSYIECCNHMNVLNQ